MQNKNYLLGWIVGSLFILFCSSIYAITFDKIVVFGDSLSDNGNVFSFTSTAHKAIPRIPIIPKEPPYVQGRFTNGQVWIEHLAQLLTIPLDDYAYGGAWVESVFDSKQTFPFSLGMQVNFYLVRSYLDNEKAKHLYVIWVGSNDYIQGRADVEYATSNTIATIKNQIDWLIYYGANNFLLLNLPDLSLTPEVMQKGPAFVENVNKLSQLHNDKFVMMIDELQKQYPQVQFYSLNIAHYFQEMIEHPDEFHIKNINEACYDGGFFLRTNSIDSTEIQSAKEAHIDIMQNASLRIAYLTSRNAAFGQQPCVNPDEYLFWDPIHPTRIVHQLLSGYALSLLGSK
ncbi:MAG: hypothetical protein A3F11_01840 [Gammaproteobacteria bacterium RIFCSPHIGHO2_12_FULL_37_14]|nr:MAG: hypothetical protein A3F11_01840 [Gammaproteobacteria bacterium RIFCSPHIGHO2_12_FULL_37_14]